MARPVVDLAGQRFGRLVAVSVHSLGGNGRHARWLTACDCGGWHIVASSHLRRGDVRSCGCLEKGNKGHGRVTKHGLHKSAEYRTWQGMISRCENEHHKAYGNYGGRGIKVCPQWRHDFLAFYKHVGPRPSPDLSIDRINNEGNYEPGNVRWATRREQNLNRRLHWKRWFPKNWDRRIVGT